MSAVTRWLLGVFAPSTGSDRRKINSRRRQSLHRCLAGRRLSNVKSLRRRCSVSCALALAVFTQAVAAYDHPAPGGETIRDKLESAAQFLADIYDRPRRVIYTPYAVSALNGIVRDFVHVSDGTAVLSRTDLVVDGPLPIAFRRAHHSARTTSEDFGTTGWRLTIDRGR